MTDPTFPGRPLRRALWVSTSTKTRGGIATYVTTMQDTAMWTRWDVHHIVTHHDGSKPAKAMVFLRGAVQFMVEIMMNRPSVIHLHASADASFTRKSILLWIGRLARTPVVLHMHGSDFWDYHQRSSRTVQSVIRSTLKHASAVVALGDAWAGQLHQIAPKARINVIPNGIPLGKRITQPAPEQPVHVVFLGRIGERKGTFRLLEAWAKLAAELPPTGGAAPAILTIAGDGEVEKARRRMNELGIESTVRLHDWLSQEQVHDLLDHAHVLVLPSRNEGQPMAVLEAMARGMCVISSSAGGLGEMIGDDCGVIVPPDDVDAIVDALRLVVEDSEFRRQCGESAYQRVRQEFDAGVVATQIEDLYRWVCR